MENKVTPAHHNERQYLSSLALIKDRGELSDNRTGINTISLFGDVNNTYVLTDNDKAIVPLLSTKFVKIESIVHELIWMLSGSSRIKYLLENKVRIWDDWVIKGTEVFGPMLNHGDRLRLVRRTGKWEAMEKFTASAKTEDELMNLQVQFMDENGVHTHELVDGDLGPVYGVQWRHTKDLRLADDSDQAENFHSRGFQQLLKTDQATVFGRVIDQIEQLEHNIRYNPNSRRLILIAWNTARIDEMALPPCHTLAQWRVTNEGLLHCKLYQRSADWMIGVPYNIVFYSVLTHMLCHVFNLKAGNLYHSVGDAHIYENHLNGMRTQLNRAIIEDNCPTIGFSKGFDSILDIRAEDIQLSGYSCHPYISLPVAV